MSDPSFDEIVSVLAAEGDSVTAVVGIKNTVVLVDSAPATPQSTARALKLLAELTRGDRRSVAVLGELTDLEESPREEHDHIGRLVVRLNVQKLIVVGHPARHIHNAAGLEGSWDGESVLVTNADEAYDVLRDELQDDDVVLVKSSGSVELASLADRLASGASGVAS